MSSCKAPRLSVRPSVRPVVVVVVVFPPSVAGLVRPSVRRWSGWLKLGLI